MRLALTKLVEIIGDAAKHVSCELRQSHPEVLWSAAARVGEAAPVHPDHALSAQVGGYVRHVRLLKQRQVTGIHTAICESGVEAVNAGSPIAGTGRQETQLRTRWAARQVKRITVVDGPSAAIWPWCRTTSRSR